MDKHYFYSRIVANKQVGDKLFTMQLKAPEIARSSSPGQFINIYFQDSVKIFPRPFSISEIKDDNIFIRYKVIGSQTKKMSEWKKNDEVRILGPLGNQFQIDPEIQSHILVGGGIGVAPLFYLRDALVENDLDVRFFIGAANRDELYILKDKNCILKLATDDGSLGWHGTVIDLLQEEWSKIDQPAVIYSCGPEPMLEALKKFGQKNNTEVQVSMEKIMACGNGLCQGCAVRTENHVDQDYVLVCKDGPIFKAKDIIIDD